MLPSNFSCFKVLTECGLEVNRFTVNALDEANQVRVADETLTQMMRFITDKYNSIDFSEIEKSAGDYTRFKYANMINENLETLFNIYQSSDDKGAEKYFEVVDACMRVRDHLVNLRSAYSTLYKQGNGLVQLMYVSLVSGIIYCVGTMVSNTIRFVTSEANTECEVVFDEIPGTIKHIHIKNILNASRDLQSYERVLMEFSKPSNHRPANESVSIAATAGVGLIAIIAVIVLVPRVIYLIREMIYSIYYTRVKVSDMLGMQADLIRVNIESLEAGRGNKKVIARQKKIVAKLEKWQNRIAIKMDSAEQLKNTQMKKENDQMKIDKGSPMVSYTDPDASSLLI